MRTKLRVVLYLAGTLLATGTTNVAAKGHCSSHITKRALGPYTVGKQQLTKLCDIYDTCWQNNAIGQEKCKEEFRTLMTKQCNHLYYSDPVKLEICLFSATSYEKILERYSKLEKQKNKLIGLRP